MGFNIYRLSFFIILKLKENKLEKHEEWKCIAIANTDNIDKLENDKMDINFHNNNNNNNEILEKICKKFYQKL